MSLWDWYVPAYSAAFGQRLDYYARDDTPFANGSEAGVDLSILHTSRQLFFPLPFVPRLAAMKLPGS